MGPHIGFRTHGSPLEEVATLDGGNGGWISSEEEKPLPSRTESDDVRSIAADETGRESESSVS